MKHLHYDITILFLLLLLLVSAATGEGSPEGEDRDLISPKRLQMFVDELPQMPKLRGYTTRGGVAFPRTLTIGMYEKNWRFHRDLPFTRVFAYGTSRRWATVPGPTIEALQGVPTRVTWVNHLPPRHLLPWDPTLTTAVVPTTRVTGVPTVVHLHGSIADPASDGNPNAWFTADYLTAGAAWRGNTSTYPNVQEPGNLWYHDHAMGLTRVNILAGLLGTYVVRNPTVESPLRLPSGQTFDRHLVVFDRSFHKNGSIFLNSTGNNPSIHPQWQPEYFGEVVVVNGKAWPVLRVRRRRYRFRIINASNARFFRFFFSNGLRFVHVGADSVYLRRPYTTTKFLLAPSEIADVVVDFSLSCSDEALLRNNAPYPYPRGDLPDEESSGMVMKFVIEKGEISDDSRIPFHLVEYPPPQVREEMVKRFVVMYEYQTGSGQPTHLYLNGRPFQSPATETPQAGSSEVWDVVNLTMDNHPLHVHLALMAVVEQRKLSGVEELKACMMRDNDAERCRLETHAVGWRRRVPPHESGWKNVFKIRPGYRTRILVRFALLGSNGSNPYPFKASDEPGYVYHCHILDHEDNEMMRPLKIID